MDDVFIPVAIVGMLFIGLPWLVFHYITRWKTAATLTTEDENLLDELHELVAKLAQVLRHQREEVLARLAARRRDVGHHLDARLGRLLRGRQHRLAGVREHGDDVGTLGDQAAHVGDRLGCVAARRGVR